MRDEGSAYLKDREDLWLPPLVHLIELLRGDIIDMDGAIKQRPCALWMGDIGNNVNILPGCNGVCHNVLDRS